MGGFSEVAEGCGLSALDFLCWKEKKKSRSRISTLEERVLIGGHHHGVTTAAPETQTRIRESNSVATPKYPI